MGHAIVAEAKAIGPVFLLKARRSHIAIGRGRLIVHPAPKLHPHDRPIPIKPMAHALPPPLQSSRPIVVITAPQIFR